MSEYNFLKILESIIDEADVSGEEAKKQDDVSSGVANHKVKNKKSKSKKDTLKDKKSKENVEEDDEETGEESSEESSEESTGEETSSTSQGSDYKISTEFSDFIDAAGALRASKSFKNKDVKKDLEEYFKGLDKGEKQSLYIFFKGITQIAAADMEGKAVKTPSDLGIKTSQKNVGEPSKPQEKKSSDSSSSKPAEKDASNPIVVGEGKQDKSSILSYLNEVNKWEN